jgi:hypothetical protein
MEYTVCEYPREGSREWGIFSKTSRCWISFGKKKEMVKKAKELNDEHTT